MRVEGGSRLIELLVERGGFEEFEERDCSGCRVGRLGSLSRLMLWRCREVVVGLMLMQPDVSSG